MKIFIFSVLTILLLLINIRILSLFQHAQKEITDKLIKRMDVMQIEIENLKTLDTYEYPSCIKNNCLKETPEGYENTCNFLCTM